jgi:proline iminopeptidase
MGVIGPRAARAPLPDSQVDGVFEAIVSAFNMWAGCPTREVPHESKSRDTRAGFGFWVNAVTTRDTHDVADPRDLLSRVTTPLLVVRGECDYIAWEVTREYRDLLPKAVLVAVNDAGHEISADQSETYSDLVRAFLLDEPLPLYSYTAPSSPW